MKTTTKLLLSLSLLLVPQIAFSSEFDNGSNDELATFNGFAILNVDQPNEEHGAEDVESPEVAGLQEHFAAKKTGAQTVVPVSAAADVSASADNSSSNVANLDAEWASFLNYLDNQPATFGERMKSKAKNTKKKLARFYKNHPDAIKRSAIASGTMALAGGAAAVYTQSSVVKENVDKAASYVAEKTSEVATKLSETYKAAKDRITKATATTRAAVDGEIEELDKTYFSRADAIVLAGAAGISYGAYKAAPTIKKAATDLGTWVSSKASEASSSDFVTDAKIKGQIVAHYVQDHKVAFAAPVVALAAAYAGFKVYKKVTAESTATTEPTEVAEDVLTPDLD